MIYTRRWKYSLFDIFSLINNFDNQQILLIVGDYIVSFKLQISTKGKDTLWSNV